MTAKSNAWRHNIQRLYFKVVDVNLGKNLGIDLGKFCGTSPSTSNSCSTTNLTLPSSASKNHTTLTISILSNVNTYEKKYKTQLTIKVNKINIKPQQSARYLGVIFDHKLDWRTHTRQVEKRTASRIGLLRFLSRSTPDSNDKILVNIFKALIRTVLTYGYPVLLSANNKIWNRLQITQNKALRAAMGLPPYTSVDFIHQRSNIPRIKQYAKVLLERSISRAQIQHDEKSEQLLSDILNSQ